MGRNEYELILVRGDRYEVLPIAMMAAYRGIKIAHIEGGDLSGAIDNKVRKAITSLADIHFATNKESYSRLIAMGTDPDLTFNYGSLDVEYAKSVEIKEEKEPFVLICHHPMPGEDPKFIEEIVRDAFPYGKIIVIKTNSDNGQSYGKEEFKPEEYINLLANAKCLIGNSSSFLKEASVFGTPVLNIGERQTGRLLPKNAFDVGYDADSITDMFRLVMKTGRKEPSDLYYKPDTSKNITKDITRYLNGTISTN